MSGTELGYVWMEHTQDESEVHELASRWVLWYHSVSDDHWDLPSYVRVDTLATVEDVLAMFDLLFKVSDRWGHFFIMREGILPMYEDAAHVNGGSWSFKVHQRKRLPEAWYIFVSGILGGFLCPPQDTGITGISMNPRNGVVKVWTSLTGESFPVLEQPPWIVQDRSMFQAHRARIS